MTLITRRKDTDLAHTCERTHVCTHSHTGTHTCTQVQTHRHTHAHTCMCIHMYIHRCRHTCTQACAQTCTQVHTCTQTCICTHVQHTCNLCCNLPYFNHIFSSFIIFVLTILSGVFADPIECMGALMATFSFLCASHLLPRVTSIQALST